MKLQRKLSKLFFAILLTLVSTNLFAETKWEVATVFLGAHEDQEFQIDIEKNIAELSLIKASPFLKVSNYRELPGKTNARTKLLTYLKNSFKDPQSKKALVLYGHGDGPLGLRDMPVQELKALLTDLNIKLDVLWFDACFLANIEFLYELRNLSHHTIASEEAEFSSGLPFESLSDLPQYNNSSEASVFLAKRFIESYSYIKDGAQRNYVSVSSATISVFDNREMDFFVTTLKKITPIIKKLPANIQSALKSRLTKNFSMDDKSMVDLGHLLIELRKIVQDKTDDTELTKMIRLLNIESVKKLKSNPRIRIVAPEARALMVFGFNDWENGNEFEYNDNPLFKSIIETNEFVKGWPAKRFLNNSTLVTPFAPGINSFNYYFLDSTGKKVISKKQSAERTHDIVEDSIVKKSNGSILVYSAYTQQLGTKAERYTGINITIFDSMPSLDYFELEFNKKMQWLEL